MGYEIGTHHGQAIVVDVEPPTAAEMDAARRVLVGAGASDLLGYLGLD